MKTAFSILLLLLTGYISAQGITNNGKISGTVKEAGTNVPVEYASVSVFIQGATTPVNGTSTDTNGNFTIEKMPLGEYRIKISFLGYKDEVIDHISLTDKNPSASFPKIIFTSSATILQGVEITAKAATVKDKIDKMVYNPEGDIAAQGGTAIDVLKKVPMVTVDINGNVELLGSPGINFLINGKPSTIFGSSLADALQSIPASQIKNIEIISNPGARYDAQGTGGIINIILKESNVEGINGSINAAIGTRVQNGSVNFNYRKGSFGFNAFVSGNNQSKTTTLSNTDLFDSRGVNLLSQKSKNSQYRDGYQGGFGFDWKISPKDNITASLKYNTVDRTAKGTTGQQQTTFDDTGNPVYTNSTSNSTDNFSENSAQYSLGYKHTFDKENQELNVYAQTSLDHSDFDYSQFQEYSTPGTASSGTANTSPGRIRESMAEVNYVHPLGDDLTVETGAKGFFKTMRSSVDFTRYDPASSSYQPDPLQSYSFTYDRNIYAYYLSASFRLFNYLDVKAGGRYEYTHTTADFPNTSIPAYSTFVPSVALMHKIDDSQLVKMSYSRRIERPDYDELNPFINMADPYNLTTGNPNLRPEIGNNFELGYNKTFTSGHTLNIITFYRRNTDDVKRYTEFYPTYQEGDITYENVSLSSRANIGQETKVGLSIFSSYSVTPQFTLRTNIMANTKHIGYHYMDTNEDIRGAEFKVNLNAGYDFPNNLSAEIFGNYNTPRIGLQGKTPSFLYYTMAIRKQLLHKNLSVGLTATNPFNTYTIQSSSIRQSGNTQFSYRRVPFQSFGITLSYKFGGLKFDEDKQNGEQSVPDGY